MRIGAIVDDNKPLDNVIAQATRFAGAGLSSLWCTQVFGFDALTLLAILGRHVPEVELGTGVVPVYPRHPTMLAQQAVTTQAASGGRLVLGVGLSHQIVVEGMWGLSYDRPFRYMREYLSVLLPVLAGETVSVEGELVTARTFMSVTRPELPPVPVLVAALGPAMLRLAGQVAAGTVTWATGVRTVGEHIAPSITAAAADAGRPAPRVVMCLPTTVTDDVDAARERIDEMFALYPGLPSYAAMLEREGKERMSDISLVGDEGQVRAALEGVASAGATDYVAAVLGTPDEVTRTVDVLGSYRS